MDLSSLLAPERICCHRSVQSKKRALQSLSEMLSESLQRAILLEEENNSEEAPNETIGSLAGRLLSSRAKSDEDSDKNVLSEMGILDAFISRERLGNTGLGHGFALPHSRIPCIKRPIAAMITLDEGIDYGSDDKQAVDLVLGLLVPEQSHDEHLEILATLAKIFSDAQFRDQMRGYHEPAELYNYLSGLAPAA